MPRLVTTSGKRALIVDDSKSARSFLRGILEQYQLEVDTAENAEEAIAFLTHSRPDVIFMDHQMPGMDGLQAVQAIKGDPRTATIPIMMYTSQEGEIYLGQARALGALGVLPKQVKPAEVSTVLYQLHILPDRRQANRAADLLGVGAATDGGTGGGDSAGTAAAAPAPGGMAAAGGELSATGRHAIPEALVSGVAAPSALRPMVEEVVRQQLADFRRTLAAILDDNSDRWIAEVRTAIAQHAAPRELPPAEALPSPTATASQAGWVAALVASIAAVLFAVLWWREAQLTSDLALRGVGAAVASGRPPVAAGTAGALAAGSGTEADAANVAPTGAPRESVQSVPYGELPISGERFDGLRRLLEDLTADRFRGTVSVTSYPGRFCLVGNPAEGYAPAASDLPVTRCDVLGNPFEDALAPAQREPLALANLVASIRQRSGGALVVELANGPEGERAQGYPPESEKVTSAEWNRAALLNNRLEIRVQPAAR